MTIHTEIKAAFDARPYALDNERYLSAYRDAESRAASADFDQHIVRDEDGRYWIADDRDYDYNVGAFVDRIVHTVPGRLHGDY